VLSNILDLNLKVARWVVRHRLHWLPC
jgi:hypothetical protein